MVRRSLLFSPGDRPEMMRKAPTTAADTVIFDLEDAVAPGRKAEARELVRDVLSAPEFDPDKEVCVRVNPGATARKDIDALYEADVRLDAVMVPKANEPADVELVAEALAAHDVDLPLLPIIETAAGVLNAHAIGLVESTSALAFGAEDLTADLGASRTDEMTEVLYAREHVVLAARAAGVGALDTVYPDFADLDGLRTDTEFALSLGFDGKAAIHPAQVAVINDAYTPEADQVEWAEKVLAAWEEGTAESKGVVRVEGEMIDAPLVTQAERIVSRARAASK